MCVMTSRLIRTPMRRLLDEDQPSNRFQIVDFLLVTSASGRLHFDDRQETFMKELAPRTAKSTVFMARSSPCPVNTIHTLANRR